MDSNEAALGAASKTLSTSNLSPSGNSAARAIRPEAIERGVRFLQNDDVRLVPPDELGKFLARVGLTHEEIQAAFDRSYPIVGLERNPGQSLPHNTAVGAVATSPPNAAASALSTSLERPPSGSPWMSLFAVSTAGLLTGYLWTKLDLRSKIQDWLDDGMADHPAGMVSALNDSSMLSSGNNIDYPPLNPLQGLDPFIQRGTPLAAANPVTSVTELQAQRSQITDALENVRRIERENAAGLNELRMLLKDMNVTMHTTLTGLQNEQNRTHMTMNTSVQALATDVSGLRRDMSMLSSDISNMSKSYIVSPGPALSTSHMLADMSDINGNTSTTLRREQPLPPASLLDGLPLPDALDPAICEPLAKFHASLLLVCGHNEAGAIDFGFPTLRMVIQNLISKPDAPRYRKIVTTNDIIRKSIISLRKHRELLVSLCFVEEQLAWKWAPTSLAAGSGVGNSSQKVFLEEADKLFQRAAELSKSHPSLFGLEASGATAPMESPEASCVAASVPYQQVVRMVLENRTAELPGIKQIPEGISVDAETLLTHQELAPQKPWQTNKERSGATSDAVLLSPIPHASPPLAPSLDVSHITNRKGPRGHSVRVDGIESAPFAKTFLDAIALAADGIKSPS